MTAIYQYYSDLAKMYDLAIIEILAMHWIIIESLNKLYNSIRALILHLFNQ